MTPFMDAPLNWDYQCSIVVAELHALADHDGDSMDSSSNVRVPAISEADRAKSSEAGCAPWLAVALCNFGMRCIIALLAKTSDSPIYWHLIYMARMFISGTCLFVFVLGCLVCFVEPGRHMKDVEKKNGGFVSSAVSICDNYCISL